MPYKTLLLVILHVRKHVSLGKTYFLGAYLPPLQPVCQTFSHVTLWITCLCRPNQQQWLLERIRRMVLVSFTLFWSSLRVIYDYLWGKISGFVNGGWWSFVLVWDTAATSNSSDVLISNEACVGLTDRTVASFCVYFIVYCFITDWPEHPIN